MPSPPKVFIKGQVLFITTSVEEGVLLPANALLNLVILSCLARAQTLHPIQLCDFIVEGTHLHLIIVVENPEDVKGFMERFKTESAHAINRLLGRKKRTVWCQGYDSPVLLTPQDVVSKLIYLYSNPVKDRLAATIGAYPGLSSWEGLVNHASLTLSVPALSRTQLRKLPEGELSKEFYSETAAALLRETAQTQRLRVFNFGWAAAFGLTEEETRKAKQAVVEGVQEIEREQAALTDIIGKPPCCPEKLAASGFNLSYRPERSGRRMWCHCHDKELRKSFIKKWKGVYAMAREVFRRWKLGDFRLPYPPGLFPPSMPKLASALPTY